MVSLRSGSCIGADQASEASGEVQSCGPKTRGRAAARSNPLTEVSKSKRRPMMERTTSRLGSKLDFLQSEAVHTRAGQPIPAISLSTELPELALDEAKKTMEASDPARGAGGKAAIGEKSQRTENSGASKEAIQGTGEAVRLGSASRGARGQASRGGSLSEDDAATTGLESSAIDEPQDAAADPDEGVTPQIASETPGGGPSSPHASELGSGAAAHQLQERTVDSRMASSSEEGSSESDSDESEDGMESFAGLAASMWAALQKQRQPSTGIALDKIGQEAASSSRIPSHPEEGGKGVTWQPQTLLPAPLTSKELIQRPSVKLPVAASKEVMMGSRDKKAESKAKKASQPRPWHELPATEMTDEVKRDLRLLRLRGAMDTKRFYKRADKGRFPSKFAIGTIVEGAADFYSGRLTNRERKQTMTEELLADPDMQQSRKRRFTALQEEKSRWSHKKHKGSGERIKKRSKPKKH